ncbi:MAG TPA: hypothetical protein VGQ19_05875 [Burkholderiales bacterium]|nr:hypothetical protein [Burkholderiales bacterium]
MYSWSGHRAQLAILFASFGACKRAEQPVAIDVVANDYAFTSPDSTPSGPTVFTLANRGTKDHELFIGLLRPEATAAQIAAAHQQGIGFRQLPKIYLDGAASVALIAAPGTTSPARVTLNLLPGRSYVLFCQLRDSVGAPQHAALGMFRLLRVN